MNLAQLLQPQPQIWWKGLILGALQGVGPVLQSGTVPTTGPYAGVMVIQGTGLVQASGPATAATTVVIAIIASGNCGAGTFQFSLDGGLTWSSTYTIPANTNASSGTFYLSAVGVTLTFINGSYLSAGNTAYFIQGESYSFPTTTPTFPVSNWEEGGPALSLIESDAQGLADLDATQAAATAGGFTQSWITPPAAGPPPSGWLDLLSASEYNRLRIQPQATQGMVLLKCAATAGPYTIAVGKLYFQSVQGQIFVNLTGGTLTSGGTLSLTVGATSPGASFNNVTTYDPANLIPGGNYLQQLLNPMPGVTVLNPLSGSPPVSHAGSGAGTVSIAGTPVGPPQSVIYKITTAGAPTVGAYAYSLNGGLSYSAPQTIAASGPALPSSPMTATFAGTFKVGDLYTWSTGWITQLGADAQTSLSLATADQNQWAQLSASSPTGCYSNWALAASPEVQTVVTTVDPLTPGQVNVLLIGPSNMPVSAAAIAAVQSYLLPRVPQCVTPNTETVFAVAIPVTTPAAGGIRVVAGQQTAAAQGIAKALAALSAATAPGSSVLVSVVAAAIQGVQGVIEIVAPGLLLNGLDADVPLQSNWVASLTPPPSSAYGA